MQESNFVYDFLANKALKGFCIQEGHVVPKIMLTRKDNEEVRAVLTESCNSYMDKWLQDATGNLNKLLEKTLDKVELFDILPGTIVKLVLSHKQTIELIYLGNYEFYVLNDSVSCFKPLDMLKALSLSFEKGCVTYFQAFRDSNPYPVPEVLFNADIQLIILMNSNVIGNPYLQSQQLAVTKSLDKVFAWSAERLPGRFNENQLTDNEGAIFYLDLLNNEFKINLDYSQLHYNDLVATLSPVCNIIHTGRGLSNISSGKFSLYETIDSYSFNIRKKAEVSI